MYEPGQEAKVTDIPGIRVGLLICYDLCFPSFVPKTVARKGTDVITLPCIDPPSRNDVLAAMHTSFTPFRSAGSGVAIVRSDGYACSMITGGAGAIIKELGSGEGKVVARTRSYSARPIEFYVRDSWVWISGFLVLIPR